MNDTSNILFGAITGIVVYYIAYFIICIIINLIELVVDCCGRIRSRIARKTINHRGRHEYEQLMTLYEQIEATVTCYDALIATYSGHTTCVDALMEARGLHTSMLPIVGKAMRRLDGLFKGNVTTGEIKPFYHKYTN